MLLVVSYESDINCENDFTLTEKEIDGLFPTRTMSAMDVPPLLVTAPDNVMVLLGNVLLTIALTIKLGVTVISDELLYATLGMCACMTRKFWSTYWHHKFSGFAST